MKSLPHIVLGLAFLLTANLHAANPAPSTTQRELSIPVDGGQLVLRPLLDNAVRVRFVRGESAESRNLILRDDIAAPEFQVHESSAEVAVEMARLRVGVDRATGTITFQDASGRVFLRELPGTRRVEAATIHDEPTWAVSQSFDSPPDERLFGTGEFQDGFLNIRDLPRRLTQVNTQIAIPFVVSSRGFGLLWHNYGLTEFNSADELVPLAARDPSGAAATVDVTTTEGTKKETRQDRAFVGRFRVASAGRYAFSLDVGRNMARRWHVEIDGKPIVDFYNFWLPPFTGCFADLEA
ncbi:MAG TPA: glycosyl hydrolase family 31, partial [Acidobacteriota bacterium]|nr:glycosyl hydrolase family 31 [Acidobacteriota bacterium]